MVYRTYANEVSNDQHEVLTVPLLQRPFDIFVEFRIKLSF